MITSGNRVNVVVTYKFEDLQYVTRLCCGCGASVIVFHVIGECSCCDLVSLVLLVSFVTVPVEWLLQTTRFRHGCDYFDEVYLCVTIICMM